MITNFIHSLKLDSIQELINLLLSFQFGFKEGAKPEYPKKKPQSSNL